MFKSARLTTATCIALALTLAGCDKGADQPAGKAAGAQVQPGTISDAMINLDQSRSQPLLQPAPPPKDTVLAAPKSDDADDASNDSVPAKPGTATAAPAN